MDQTNNFQTPQPQSTKDPISDLPPENPVSTPPLTVPTSNPSSSDFSNPHSTLGTTPDPLSTPSLQQPESTLHTDNNFASLNQPYQAPMPGIPDEALSSDPELQGKPLPDHPSRKKLIFFILLLIVISALATGGYLYLNQDSIKPVVKTSTTDNPLPTVRPELTTRPTSTPFAVTGLGVDSTSSATPAATSSSLLTLQPSPTARPTSVPTPSIKPTLSPTAIPTEKAQVVQQVDLPTAGTTTQSAILLTIGATALFFGLVALAFL